MLPLRSREKAKTSDLYVISDPEWLALPIPGGGSEDTSPRKLNLVRQERLFEIAERGGYRLKLEGRQAMQRAIDMDRGGIWLDLTEDQYRKLKGGQ